jgi:hypothetical protein
MAAAAWLENQPSGCAFESEGESEPPSEQAFSNTTEASKIKYTSLRMEFSL